MEGTNTVNISTREKKSIFSILIAVSASVVLCLALAACGSQNSLGDFEQQTSVGYDRPEGAAEFNSSEGVYRITGSGENMWEDQDAFHYLWRQTDGDLTMTADVEWVGEGVNAHRKAGWVVRGGLEADAPYADAIVHGDGLISLQYREVAGGPTKEVQAVIKAPATIHLERTGNLFTVYTSKSGGPLHPVGSVTVELADPVYAGLAVCSHDAGVQETAIFSNVAFNQVSIPAEVEREVESTLEIINIETGQRRIVRPRQGAFRSAQLVAGWVNLALQQRWPPLHDPYHRRRTSNPGHRFR